MSVYVTVLISVATTTPQNNTTLITRGSETTQQLMAGRYDPVGIIIPLNNTTLITRGEGRQSVHSSIIIGKMDEWTWTLPNI